MDKTRVESLDNSIFGRVAEIVADVYSVDVATIFPQTRFDEINHGLNDHAEISVELERTFDHAIPVEAEMQFESVDDVVRYLMKQNVKPRAPRY